MNKYHKLTSGGGHRSLDFGALHRRLRPLVTGELHKWGAAHEREDERCERDGAPRAE